jgi:hypothetical protein
MGVLKRRKLTFQRRIVMVGLDVSRRGKWISQPRAAMIGHGILKLNFPTTTELELRHGSLACAEAGFGSELDEAPRQATEGVAGKIVSTRHCWTADGNPYLPQRASQRGLPRCPVMLPLATEILP